MNLGQMRAEVLAHGFDTNVYGARINGYLNDGYQGAARRAPYYTNERVAEYQTGSLNPYLPLPQNFAVLRSVRLPDFSTELVAVDIRKIDRATAQQARPVYYALSTANILLFPSPDALYNVFLRYWTMPSDIAADSDVPTLPADYHELCIYWALKRCFAADDDPQMAQYWGNEYEMMLKEFSAAVKFPSTDAPHVVEGMWDEDEISSPNGWTRGWA
jgi:hypothetical protein